MKVENIWDAVATIVALLFSIIIWFSWLGQGDYTITGAIDLTVSWLIGVLILVLGATVIDFTGTKVRKSLKYEEKDIWEALSALVAILLTIILWFGWLGTQDFTVLTVIDTAITWIVVTLILNLGAIFIGYFNDTLKASLK